MAGQWWCAGLGGEEWRRASGGACGGSCGGGLDADSAEASEGGDWAGVLQGPPRRWIRCASAGRAAPAAPCRRSPTPTPLTYSAAAAARRFAPQSVKGFKAREHLVISRWNEFGIFIFVAYLAAAGFYFWARIQHTLDIGWVWWAAAALCGVQAGSAACMPPAGLPVRCGAAGRCAVACHESHQRAAPPRAGMPG